MSAGSGEYIAYHAHLMTCRSCYAPTSRYCDVGRDLRLQAEAAFIASLKTLPERRYWRALEEKNHPENMVRLDELIKQKYRGQVNG
ncbi:hypothetical protein [Stutzerimonas nitrititolerans]|uniref:hypothetical protein n=1 Tax=Stutzerimonas nitrititolerans TaxID=2482751 RepID=UPI0028AADE17|nr:hypothetical protein [Stutzerimonas nitrititolerans]